VKTLARQGVDLKGKIVNIYFLDHSDNKVSKKTGKCLKDTSHKITIENSRGYAEIIPYCRIIRVIETGEGK